MACALVSPCGCIELLGRNAIDVGDVLQEPIHSLTLRGLTLFFSSSSFFTAEVNEFASGLAKQQIKGDAFLVHAEQQALLNCLLQSKQLRLAQAEAPCTPSSSPNSSHALLVARLTGGVECPAAAACEHCGGDSSSCLLKQPRSLQHIVAANSTRQWILGSMSATGRPACASPTAMHTPSPAVPLRCTKKPADSAAPSLVANDAVYSSSVESAYSSSSSSVVRGSGSPGLPAVSSSRRMPPAAPVACQDCRSSDSGSNIPFSSYNTGSSTSRSRHNSQQWQPAQGLLQHCSGSSDNSSTVAPDDVVPMDVDGPQQQQQQQQGTELRAACDPAAVTAMAGPDWSDLPVEVIAQVARFMGSTVAAVMPICMTCRSWRQAVLEDDQLLLGLTFKLGVAPPRCSSSHAVRTGRAQHPRLLERAAKLGNVSALVVRARLLDAAGCPDEAMRCWKRAAKAGHLEGQLLYGLALYRGSAGVAPDAEDAHLWLSKALKQVLATKPAGSNEKDNSSSSSSSDSRSSASVQPGASSTADSNSSNDGGGSSTPLPRPVPSNCVSAAASASCSRQQCSLSARVLTQAGLVLGYLAFDGEGTRTDKQEAVRYFKLAAQAGSPEAAQVLGWIFNTGQY